MSEERPAGWYDDPELVNTRRYWDGEKWTEHRQEKSSTASADPVSSSSGQEPTPPTVEPAKDRRLGCGGFLAIIAGLIGIVYVISLLTGGSGSDNSTADTGSSSPSKYQQTWSKDYAHTSCDEWTNTMDPHQRFAAAADMLTGARNKGDGGTGVPSDDLVRTFEQGLDNACVEPTSTLSEIGAALYLTERSTFRP